MEREAKQAGDKEPVKAWKYHNGECQLIHQKVDIIASRLGVTFYTVGKGHEEAVRPWDSCGRCGKKHKSVISPSQRDAVPPCSVSVPAQAMVSSLPSAFKKMV